MYVSLSTGPLAGLAQNQDCRTFIIGWPYIEQPTTSCPGNTETWGNEHPGRLINEYLVRREPSILWKSQLDAFEVYIASLLIDLTM